jgi:hypothetical protein
VLEASMSSKLPADFFPFAGFVAVGDINPPFLVFGL